MSIVRIISFTEAGYQLSCKMQDCLQERAEVVLIRSQSGMRKFVRCPMD